MLLSLEKVDIEEDEEVMENSKAVDDDGAVMEK